MLSKQKEKGFTLIEIIVVLGIIAVLGLGVVPRIMSSRKASAENKILNEMKATQQSMVEARNAGINPYATFIVKDASYTDGIELRTPNSLATKTNSGYKKDTFELAVSGADVKITGGEGITESYYLGKKSDIKTATATFKVSETGILADTSGVKPVFDTNQQSNSQLLITVLKGMGYKGELTKETAKTEIEKIFGSDSVEPIIELTQLDFKQLKPFLTSSDTVGNKSKYITYIVTNRKDNPSTGGIDDGLYDTLKQNTLVVIPRTMDDVVYSQSSGYKNAVVVAN